MNTNAQKSLHLAENALLVVNAVCLVAAKTKNVFALMVESIQNVKSNAKRTKNVDQLENAWRECVTAHMEENTLIVMNNVALEKKHVQRVHIVKEEGVNVLMVETIQNVKVNAN